MKKIILALLLLLGSVTLSDAGVNIGCGVSLGSCTVSPTEGSTLFNTQTTGGATTAVTVTLTAVAGARTHLYRIDARCNTDAATSNLTITDGGTTVWSTAPTEVGSANGVATAKAQNYTSVWPVGWSSAVVITLAACTAGTGTLIIEADKY